MDVPQVRYADVGGGSIAYQTFGEGPPDLVITPGFVSHLDLQWTMPSYFRFFEMLASFARVIIFDKRGTGLSDPTPTAIRFDQRADDILAVMDAAGSQKAVLMGISEGGPLSILVAANHPERVQCLVLYGTFAAGSHIASDQLTAFEAAIDDWGSGLTAQIFGTSDAESGLRRRLAAVFERASASPGMARALVDSVRTADVSAVLPLLDMPCLVIHRRDDPFAPLEWGQELAEKIPNSRMVVTEGADHLPWFGDYASIASAVADFLGNNEITTEGRRRVATIMFTDIVNSTAKAVELGDQVWTELLEQHNLLMRDQLDMWRGEEVKTLGDGFLSLFDSPARGVECAHSVMRGMEALDLVLRAGLHTGEVEVMSDDVAGLSVHVASRIAALAAPNEVLVSNSVRELCIGAPLDFHDRGTKPLKGLPGQWQLYSTTEKGDELIIDLREPKELTAADHMSLFLARRAPLTLRTLAGLASRPT
ncbi:MAG: adenylate/guanylate cyclase domain-containing protein [Actinomycetota bacterium]